MQSLARITVHASQFPGQVRRDLLESLRARRINPKFHYDSIKQTQQWLALHKAFSPSRTDAETAAIYDLAFAAAANRMDAQRIHLIGLGCGGGQKDVRLLKLLREAGKETRYTPVDVSTAMVLTARQTVLEALPEEQCFPFVCDLGSAADFPDIMASWPPSSGSDQTHPPACSEAASSARLTTFFGMIPNFEPEIILPRLAALTRPGEGLLFSANLAPGPDYAGGVRKILPLYDNDLTREWLLMFLLDLGFEKSDGELRFAVENGPGRSPMLRIVAYFDFNRPRQILVDEHRFEFPAGASIRLFFSYRHTPELVRSLLEAHGLIVENQWIAPSQEEGVFLVSGNKTSGSRISCS